MDAGVIFVNAALIKNAAKRINKPGNAGVRGARNRSAIFNRPKRRHRKMLRGGGTATIPRIIRHNHQKLRSPVNKFSH